MLAVWRRERDSNPRCLSTSPVFKTGSLNHSDISPSYSCLDIIAIRHRIVKAFRRKPGKRGDGKGHRPSACRKTPGGSGAAMQFAKVALRRPVGPSWRSLAHWASASLLPPLAAFGFALRRLSSDLATQGELSRRDKRRPPGGCTANPQKALRSKGFPA